MKHIFRFLTIMMITVSLKANATAQFGEVLFVDTTRYSMRACPLDQFKQLDQLKNKYPRMRTDLCSALWRGYIGYWQLQDNKLYLDSIQIGYDSDTAKVIARNEPLFDAYKTTDGRILAGWYSGEVSVTSGNLVHYVHMGFESVFKHEDIYTIDNGMVTGVKHYDNKYTVKGDDMRAALELEQYIAGVHPEYTGKIVVSAAASEIEQNGNLKKIDVKLRDNTNKDIDTDELCRLAEEFLLKNPPFSIIYVRGEYDLRFAKCTFALVFDKEQHEKRMKFLKRIQEGQYTGNTYEDEDEDDED